MRTVGTVEAEPVVPPVYLSAIYRLGPTGAGSYRYSRESNPTVETLEEILAAYTGSSRVLSFNSGLAAIATVLLGVLDGESVLVVPWETYGSTFELLRELASRLGAGFEPVWPATSEIIERVQSVDGRPVFFGELYTNPTLKVLDVAAIVEAVDEAGGIAIVDVTLATSLTCRPLRHGVDIVVESLSKYVSGHNDVLGGFAAFNDEMVERGVYLWRKLLGTIIQPFDAYLVLRGAKTLWPRYRIQSKAALEVAEFLEDHPGVEEVFYPGLQGSPYKSIADRLCVPGLYGGVVSFRLSGSLTAERFISRLKAIRHATSFGGVDTTVSVPAWGSASKIPGDVRARLGVDERLVRLSLGVDMGVEDVIEELSRALS